MRPSFIVRGWRGAPTATSGPVGAPLGQVEFALRAPLTFERAFAARPASATTPRSARRDRDAVLAALCFRWSNGQVEGPVDRIKLVKRNTFGRAGFPLLRTRVLHAA